MTRQIVTKDWLRAKVWINPAPHNSDWPLLTPTAPVVVGRALVAIQNRQDANEVGVTLNLNGRGFAKPDANVGLRCAVHFQKTGTLLPWMLEVWTKPAANGYPRICKYSNQLNEVANERLLENHNL